MKGIAYPLKTYRVVGCRDGMRAGLPTIDEERQGFRLLLEPWMLAAEDVEGARSARKRDLRAPDPSSRAGGPATGTRR